MATEPLIRDHAGELRGRRSECAVLDALTDAVRGGSSQALVVRGEPGVGKTALLGYVAERASDCRVIRAAGVESEMELAFAAVHQLLSPMLDRADRLPEPQHNALCTAFGLNPGPAPDRFLVALAVLTLLSVVAEERPLICVVDDEQWLDRASAQALAFVARRLDTESVGLVFGTRAPDDMLTGLPELVIDGLRELDARALLESVLTGPLDERVRDRIVSETRGNPLALLELPRGVAPAELAGGFGLPGAGSITGRIEENFRRRLNALPAETRRLIQLAAADPVGEPSLVWRAAGRLGILPAAATPAADAGLLEFGARVRFRHPLVRSAAYLTASLQERQEAHGALAAVTDAAIDPDRRAWHLAQAAPGPDELVAGELERSAGRAQARGGLAAAAAFLERAAMLTPDPPRRSRRLLAAARAECDAGALDASLGLLVVLEAGPLDERQRAEIEHLRGRVAVVQRRVADAVPLLLSAATRFEALDAAVARDTHLEALGAAIWGAQHGTSKTVRDAAEAARAAPPGPNPPRAVDVLLDAFALRFADGYTAAAPTLARAFALFVADEVATADVGRWLWLAGSRAGAITAVELWDFYAWDGLAARQVRFARDTGALVLLQFAVGQLAWTRLVAGELATSARLIEEDELIAKATGNQPVGYPAMVLAAWRGHEPEASELISRTRDEAAAGGVGRVVTYASYASAVLYNGLGRHDEARDAAWQAFEHDPVGIGPLVVPELAEAAARTGDARLLNTSLDWLTERVRMTPTPWALGIETRVRALLSEGEAADGFYQASLAHLGESGARLELARAHLLYGEWLRRDRRRLDARQHLRTAHETLMTMGVDAFAERAGRELLATGETARKRTVETRDDLTAQEAQIARLARDGLSNPEIGTRMFITPRTVKYHLSKVFTKLDITSRSQLDRVLPGDAAGTV
jgi:DNA-binding CsgD family transcriptional regulator/tetratricopeptide (TPR) repeat protein